MIFNNGMVSVDRNFVRVGSKSYAVDKIGSIDVRNRAVKGQYAYYFFWGVAALFAVGAIVNRDTTGLVVAFVLAIIGLPSYRKRKAKHYFGLVLLTNAGETQAFESRDSEEIMDIRDAIETAMTTRSVGQPA